MKVLAVNVGSTSFKYKLYDLSINKVLAKGKYENIGTPTSIIKHNLNLQEINTFHHIPDHFFAVKETLNLLQDPKFSLLTSLNDLNGIGFKTVHGGSVVEPLIINEDVITKMSDFNFVAPAHNPAYIKVIKSFQEVAPLVPLVAVFETWFHKDLEEHVYTYGLPYDWVNQYGIRKYGFHGASFRYISERVPEFLNIKKSDLNIVACHLGGSSSICAIKNGISIDTSMGFSPQSGLPMGTRCGNVDVFSILNLMEKEKISNAEMKKILTTRSGIAGISGIGADFRDLVVAFKEGNHRAKLAVDNLVYNVKLFIGAYNVALSGLDVLVFTGGIGENGSFLREKICEGLDCIGLYIDSIKNKNCQAQEMIISSEKSPKKILVIPTDEEWIVARETMQVIKNQEDLSE